MPEGQGYPTRTGTRRPDDPEVVCGRVCEEYANGVPQDEIATRYDLTIWDVAVYHTAHGIPLRHPNANGGIPRAERGEHVANHWRTVHRQEPPQSERSS